MRRFVVTADIHICIKKDISEEWQLRRYSELFDTLISTCSTTDSELIIAGDLFDKAHPTLQELQIAFKLFKALERADIYTFIIGGNHETISKYKDTYSYLIGYLPENITIQSGHEIICVKEGTCIHLVSHCDLADSYANFDPRFKHILVTHFRTDVGEYIKEEIDTAKLCRPFDLVIAGDIHTDLTVGNLMYTNQPINTQFETTPNTGYIILELGQNADTHRIKTYLPSLRQINCSAQELTDQLTLVNDRDFYRINVEGSLQELRLIKVDLPNVKVNRIPIIDNTLLVDSEQIIVEDLPLDAQILEYLKLLKYDDVKINDLLNVWREI